MQRLCLLQRRFAVKGRRSPTGSWSANATVKGPSVRKEIDVSKRRQRLIVTGFFLAILCCLTVVASYFYVVQLSASSSASNGDGNGKVAHENAGDAVRRAAFVDALSVEYPNAAFTEDVGDVLRQAGLTVDFFSGSIVTVDFLKNLGADYKVVILRLHSAVSVQNELYLFTAEPFSGDKYVQERSFGLVKEAYPIEGNQSFFAVNWGFVKRLMPGRFNGSTVIAMGCDSGVDQTLASEFINQGAVAFVGWSGQVLLSHSDRTTLQLLKNLYVEKLGVSAAVDNANSEVGADPSSGAVLRCYLS